MSSSGNDDLNTKVHIGSVLIAYFALISSCWFNHRNIELLSSQLKNMQESSLASDRQMTTTIDALSELVRQEARLVDESVRNWDRDFNERVAPHLLFKSLQSTVAVQFDTRRRIWVPVSSNSATNRQLPVVVNAGQGPAVQPMLHWRYWYKNFENSAAIVGPSENTEEYQFPNGSVDVLHLKEELGINWIPKVVADDANGEIRSLHGTVTITCTGKQAYCATYDFVAIPSFRQAVPRVEFEFSSHRNGPCCQSPQDAIPSNDSEVFPNRPDGGAPDSASEDAPAPPAVEKPAA